MHIRRETAPPRAASRHQLATVTLHRAVAAGGLGVPRQVALMDGYDRIAALFHRRIDCIAGAVDALAPGLEIAAGLLATAVLEDRKIIVCACAADAGLAEHIAAALRAGSGATPSLPAIAITAPQAADDDAPLWRDLRTLSRDGDVLLCIDSSDHAAHGERCAAFARQRNLVSIALSESCEQPTGVCVALPAADSALRSELVLMAGHGLLEQLRHNLLGE